MVNHEGILTVRDVAVYLKMAESTVYKLANDGQIPGRKVGGGWRFSKKELERWLLRPEPLLTIKKQNKLA